MVYSLLFALVPILAYLCLAFLLFNRHNTEDLRLVFLRAGILFVIYLILAEEVLSLFHAVTRIGLLVAWLVPILGVAGYLARLQLKDHGVSLPHFSLPTGWSSWLSLLLVAFVVAVTFIVAWLSPPQTWDALSYHLSRVAHWAQDQSVAHYITGIERQNSMNPGGEMITLNFYVLTGGDRLATFTQWFAMVGSMLGVSLIAAYLGAKKNGQWLAVCLAITVPIGITQSSSTITDYIATVWVICAVVEILHYLHSRNNRGLIYLGLSAGLALLTKSTTIPFLAPFAVWSGVLIMRQKQPLRILGWGLTTLLVVLLVNAAYFTRNYRTYGAIYSPVDSQKHLNQLRTIPGTISILIRNAGQQAGMTDLPAWNNWVDLNILKVHIKLGLDRQDPRTTNEGTFRVTAPTTSEDRTTNPYHVALILAVFPLALLMAKKVGWTAFIYYGLAAAGYVLFSFLFKWNIFSVRYQLTFFIVMMPFAAVVLGKIERIPLGLVVAFALLYTSLPWLFQISNRPIIPIPGQSLSQSILVEPREDLYYASVGGPDGLAYQAVHQIASTIKAQGCTQVGIMLLGDAPEYLFWEAMKAPDKSLRMEWNVVGGYSDKYAPLDFNPCAFVCTGCLAGGSTVRNQNIYLNIGDFELFMNPAEP